MSVERCDVLVAGGGSAGVAAAIAAARCGARTLLVERSGTLGGMPPLALVHSICGLYLHAENPTPEPANGGFAGEFTSRLIRGGGASGPVRMGRVDVLMQSPVAFARLCDEIVSETENLSLRLHTEVVGAAVSGGIRSLEICCRGVHETIEPRVVVDASGDAVVAALAGAEFEMEESPRLQRPAFIFGMQGVETAALDEAGRMKLAHRIADAVRSHRLPQGALGAALRLSGRAGEAFATIDLDPPGGVRYDPLDVNCLTALELHGRRLASALAAFLKNEAPGFGGSFISTLPARVGIRESRRIVGEYRIETGDLLHGAQFGDAVAVAAWPMELRERTTGPRFRFPEGGRPCGIPLRALRSKSFANLLMAGRCISSSHEAQASLRVIGTCLATGEAAGIAASLLASGAKCDAQSLIATRETLARQ
jgi:hypothetical protein